MEFLPKRDGFSYAEQLDVPENTVKTWRKRGKIPLDFLVKFSREHKVSLDYLVNGVQLESSELVVTQVQSQYQNQRQSSRRSELVRINHFDIQASAGPGAMVYEERVIGHIEVARSWLRDILHAEADSVAMITVDGESMEPTLHHGELVLIDLRKNIFHDNAVYAIQIGGRLMIKRVQVKFDGTVVIRSDNPLYEPEILTSDAASQLHVVGRLIPWKFGKFKL
ncbi:MAG TPA: LexA family transcriptional regulator [Methylophilaceae bacterium]|nr:LexA family transcriptional regulator [Methylophilaceae bacterium]